MLHSITQHQIGRLGAIALLLLVPMSLFHHLGHDHGESDSDHVHYSSGMNWCGKSDHSHEDHDCHPTEDHELASIRLEKTKTDDFFVDGAVCFQTGPQLPSFESVWGPEPGSGKNPCCRSRAPPFSLLV